MAILYIKLTIFKVCVRITTNFDLEGDNMERIPTYKMVRELPNGAKVVKIVNGIELYNMNIFQNIMSWNQHNLDVPALEYFGNQIPYGQLPQLVDTYSRGFKKMGVKYNDIVTMSLPVSNEYILSLFATANMGVISNNVNFLFLRNGLKTYTTMKDSDTLMILDVYLPYIAKQLKNTNIKNVILTSLEDYLPEDRKDEFKDLSKLPKNLREMFSNPDVLSSCLDDIRDLKGINFIRMSDIIKEGEKSNEVIVPQTDIEKDSIYSYTSGTTGAPKCIVFKEQSPNAIIEMHNGLDLKEYVGDRSLLVIPSSHATGMFYATYLQMAKGKTMVLQPIYDKNRYATDIRDFNINHTLGAGSFYMGCVANGNLGPNALSKLTRPCTGGEPISKSNVEMINKWLKENGCQEKIAIGGGTGEVGSSALTSYTLDSKTKTNETGKPIPGVFAKIVDPITGKEVIKGNRGIIHISSAAAADRYLNNEKATNNYFYYDDQGRKWANLGDIAVQNDDDSYTMLGRSTDSYTENGKTTYLFDIEYELSIDDPVLEWEISAFETDKGFAKVAQIVMKPEFIGKESEVIEYLCKKYNLDGVKIYDSFKTSEVTGKRDYQGLKKDRFDYYQSYDENNLMKITFVDKQQPITEIVAKTEVNTNVKKKSLI